MASRNLTEEELERNVEELRVKAYEDYFQIVGEMYFGAAAQESELERHFQRLLMAEGSSHGALNGADQRMKDGVLGEVGGVLTSEFRESEVVDNWTPLEIALFIGAITRYGRDWKDLQSALPGKSHQELTDFYYGVFKGLRIYPAWKKTRKLKGLEY